MNYSRQRNVWRSVCALGCLVSVLFFSVASVAHVHNGVSTSSLTQDCRFCAVSGINKTFAVPLTATGITLYVLFVLPLQADRPFALQSRYAFSSRSPPLLP